MHPHFTFKLEFSASNMNMPLVRRIEVTMIENEEITSKEIFSELQWVSVVLGEKFLNLPGPNQRLKKELAGFDLKPYAKQRVKGAYNKVGKMMDMLVREVAAAEKGGEDKKNRKKMDLNKARVREGLPAGQAGMNRQQAGNAENQIRRKS